MTQMAMGGAGVMRSITESSSYITVPELLIHADNILPKEIIKRIAAGMNFGNHLVEITTKLIYTDLIFS